MRNKETSSGERRYQVLCGVIEPPPNTRLAVGFIELKRGGGSLEVSPNDPGLAKIKAGTRRMIIVKDGRIIAVFGRPRIKLLRMLEQNIEVTQDFIDCFGPMYPKPEKIFRTTYKSRGTYAQRVRNSLGRY